MPNDRNNVIAYFKFYPLCLLPGALKENFTHFSLLFYKHLMFPVFVLNNHWYAGAMKSSKSEEKENEKGNGIYSGGPSDFLQWDADNAESGITVTSGVGSGTRCLTSGIAEDA